MNQIWFFIQENFHNSNFEFQSHGQSRFSTSSLRKTLILEISMPRLYAVTLFYDLAYIRIPAPDMIIPNLKLSINACYDMMHIICIKFFKKSYPTPNRTLCWVLNQALLHSLWSRPEYGGDRSRVAYACRFGFDPLEFLYGINGHVTPFVRNQSSK